MLAFFTSFAFPVGLWLLILGYELSGLMLMIIGWGATIALFLEIHRAEINDTEEMSDLREQNNPQP